MRKLLIISDMDGTLIKGNSWVKFNREIGTIAEDEALFKKFAYDSLTEGKLFSGTKSTNLWNALIADMWKNKGGFTESQARKFFLNYTLQEGAANFFRLANNAGFDTALVTTSPSIVANDVADKCGIENVISNEFIFDENHNFSRINTKLGVHERHEPIIRLANKLGYDLRDVVYIGDSEFDIPGFVFAGLGIGFIPEEVKVKYQRGELKDYQSKSLFNLIDFIQKNPKAIIQNDWYSIWNVVEDYSNRREREVKVQELNQKLEQNRLEQIALQISINSAKEKEKQENLEAALKEKGLVQYEGQWVTPNQAEFIKHIESHLDTNFSNLDPYEFESFVAELFNKMGYSTKVTPRSKDHGLDVIAEKDKEVTVIQVKQYNSEKVSADEVRETIGSKAIYDNQYNYEVSEKKPRIPVKAVVVTNSYFTDSAKEDAKDLLTLWDKDALHKLVKKYFLNQN